MRCPIKTTTKPTKTSRTTTRKTTSIATVGVTEAPATVVCTASSMVVELPKEPLRLVKVLDKSNRWVAVIDAPKYCNYTLLQGRGGNFFITPYTACDVRILDKNYVLKIWYLATGGKKGYMVMKCPIDAGEPTKAPTTTWEPTKITRTTSRKTTRTTIGEPTRTTSRKTTTGRPTRTTSRKTTTGRPTRTTSRKTTTGRTTSRKTTTGRITSRKTTTGRTTTTIGEPTRTTSRKTTTGRPTRTTSRKTTTGRPTRTTSRKTTTGRPTRTTTGRPTRTTSRKTTTTIGEPTRTTSRKTTTGRTTRTTSRKTTTGRTTRTTSRKTTTTTIGEPTRTTSRKTTTGRTTRTTSRKTTTGRTTRTTTGRTTRTTSRKTTTGRTTRTTTGRTTRTTSRKTTTTTIGEPTRTTSRKTTTGRTTRTTSRKTTTGRTTRTTSRKTTTGRTTRTTSRKTTTTIGEPTRTTSRKTTTGRTTRTTSRKTTTTIGEPTRTTSRKTTTGRTTRTTSRKTTTGRTTRTTSRKTTTGRTTRTTRTTTGRTTRSTSRKTTKAPTIVVCTASSMVVELPNEPLRLVKVLDKSNQWVVVIDAPKYCNYTLLQGRGGNFFITPYTACDVRILNNNYVLKIWYLTTGGIKGYVVMKCPTSAGEPTKTPSSPSTTGKPPIPTVCKASVMTLELPEGPIEQVALIDKSNTLVTVKDDTRKCGYSLVHGRGKNIFTTPYTACDVKMLNGNYVLTLAYVTLAGERVLVQMKCPTSAALPTGLPLPPFGVSVLCSDTCMTVELPGGLLQDIQLMDESNNLVAVTSAPKICGYSLVRGNGKNILTAPYKACNVKILNNFYILRVIYTTLTGERGDIQAKCPVPGLVPREGCKIPRSRQVACGPPNADPQLCVANGCCVDATTSRCYYPLNACTADGHFVFSVDRTSTKPEIDPGSLVIAGNRSCAPVICTPDFAIFKFPVTGCGTHVFTVAETTIYLAEVHGLVRGNQQMYGQITRDGPYRFQVECRYSKRHLASTGYLVVNPPLPSAALAFGSLGVRLRIATDTSYTSFYPRSHLPLSFLLGSKVYLEVQLVNPPNPNVVLLVHYCIAYPQSSQAAWVILYEGCPNILDYSSAAGLHVKYNNMPVSKHTRRFEIQSFQFLDYKTKQHLDEEIYFLCSTEVCSPEHRVCNEGCFDGRDMPVPVDLGVGGRCAGKPCPVKSNVVKRAAHGHTGLIAVGEGTFLLDEPVPHEQMEKHWTHFHGLLGLLALLVSVSVVMLFLK
ncbi:uncharacterized protein LOC117405627 [Acipenser ruthenus]|uniref:uncharacterized protein LOC117405627 n=1 Tax=Acipenser ruthenus TaxID=7906 RepID=UPI0027417F6D|nr:uncharacterized protein LOC117405627 [Acipenser ruthenus]